MARFSTSARTIDMLGRQQIAGIPTALSEVFKNAYDAYASSVRGDFVPSRSLLVIRDDGIGMTERDFLERWLTVGTSSKVQEYGLPSHGRPTGVLPRKPMGEKGIGRLAIAITGPQLLVVTRARENVGTSADGYTVALLQWTLFETPGLTLNDVVVPIRFVRNLSDVSRSLLDSMAEEIRDSLLSLGDSLPEAFRTRVENQLLDLGIDVAPLLTDSQPDLAAVSGTAFIVTGVSDELARSIDKGPDKLVSDFDKMLQGFTLESAFEEDTQGERHNKEIQNPLSTRAEITAEDIRPLPFRPSFIIHTSEGPRDLLDDSYEFWSHRDFENTDHLIQGEFDIQGRFRGTISLFGGEPKDIVEAPPSKLTRALRCGPFSVKFGYVQGESKDSRLSPEQFSVAAEKLGRIGGLYIYRDGIRVLPYGNSDIDYLDIEKRRTNNAGREFFSYRRLMGYVKLDSEVNSNMREKAGREGFHQNAAYEDFRQALMNLFVQLSRTYFSKTSDQGREFVELRDGNNRRAAAAKELRIREKAQRDSRRKYMGQVAQQLEVLRSPEMVLSVNESAASLINEIVSADSVFAVQEIRVKSKRLLRKRASDTRVTRPRSLPLTDRDEREPRHLDALREQLDQYIDTQLSLIAEESDRRIVELSELSGPSTHKGPNREAVEGKESDDAYQKEFIAHIASKQLELRKALEESVFQLWERLELEVSALGDYESRVGSNQENLSNIDRIEQERLLQFDFEAAVQGVFHHIEAVEEFANGHIDANELSTELEAQMLEANDRSIVNGELLQLGQAVQVLSHEFENNINSVRSGLRRMRPWTRSNPTIVPIMHDIEASFAHLDGYLRLFTPMQRRLYREHVYMSGEQIMMFIRGVFVERLKHDDVTLRSTRAFDGFQIYGFPSTFYPVFVNIVENSMYWVLEAEHETREIVFDVNEERNGVIVTDTGPGIRADDVQVIFEPGFGRRNGGRGLGLALAKQTLSESNWGIEAYARPEGAYFHLYALAPSISDGE